MELSNPYPGPQAEILSLVSQFFFSGAHMLHSSAIPPFQEQGGPGNLNIIEFRDRGYINVQMLPSPQPHD